ncbi:putative RNA-binding protein 15B [Clupea harengus]|uniref:RNA-binding protein 15B n=1 Tax=Clupea harengus TaxID=7950 RepID=A0A6P3VJZ1_CLUHA|nr:putative RNA-binding protein 15B [Clupea harengus]
MCTSCQIGGICFQAVLFLHSHGKVEYRLKMKRQAERDSSPARAIPKRIREREREESRRDDGPTPLAVSLADTRCYHKHQARSRSREREKPRLREERGAVGDLLHRTHHEIGLLGRPPLRTTSVVGKSSAELLGSRTAAGLEYKTLLISNLGSQLSDEHVEDGLFHEFKKFGDVSVKLSHTPELGRVAYVNFRHTENAREARHMKARLVLYDRPLKVEPMYMRRRSCTPPDVGYVPLHSVYQYRQRSLSPGAGVSSIREARSRHYPAADGLGLSRERERVLDYYNVLDERGRPYTYQVPEEDLKPEDDQRATRNLFIGNLEHSVSEVELRQGFDKYGIIEEVVIKRPARGQGGAYAFLKFQNLDMAHRAKVAMQGRIIGGNAVKIGYGKANPTTRLWVGGLGPNISLAALAREFDRFGSIRTIDYVKGDNFAYVQYESLDAAQAACTQMRGFPLGGPSRRLRVDFAKAEDSPRGYPQQYQPPLAALPAHYELLTDGYSHHRSLERELRARGGHSPTHPLFAEREQRPLVAEQQDWSPPKNVERRTASLEVFGRTRAARSRSRSRERWLKERDVERGGGAGKSWEERRKRCSRSSERPSDDRGRSKTRAAGGGSGGPVSPEDSPERACTRLPDSTSEPQEESPPEGGLHSPNISQEPSHDTHTKKHPTPIEQRQCVGGRETDADSQTEKKQKPVGTLLELAQSLSQVWHGSLVLKNSCFPTHMHLLEGSSIFALTLLRDPAVSSNSKPTTSTGQLKIAQRLRLDQPKLDEVMRRIHLGGPEGYTVLLALQAPMEKEPPPTEPGLQKRLLRNLVTYLRNKQAAGVISLPLGGVKEHEGGGGMLYAFPPCDFSQQYLKSAVRMAGKVEEEHLVIVIVKDTI